MLCHSVFEPLFGVFLCEHKHEWWAQWPALQCSPNGTLNQHSCSTESASAGETHHPKEWCMEPVNWPIEVQLGSTNSKDLPVLFQGSHQGSFLNEHCLLWLLLPEGPELWLSIQPSLMCSRLSRRCRHPLHCGPPTAMSLSNCQPNSIELTNCHIPNITPVIPQWNVYHLAPTSKSRMLEHQLKQGGARHWVSSIPRQTLPEPRSIIHLTRTQPMGSIGPHTHTAPSLPYPTNLWKRGAWSQGRCVFLSCRCFVSVCSVNNQFEICLFKLMWNWQSMFWTDQLACKIMPFVDALLADGLKLCPHVWRNHWMGFHNVKSSTNVNHFHIHFTLQSFIKLAHKFLLQFDSIELTTTC